MSAAEILPLPAPDEHARLAERLGRASAAEVLAWADGRFGGKAAIASSFSVEDAVLVDLAVKHAPRVRIFTLDTGRLPPETYEAMEVIRKRYGLTIETYAPGAGAGGGAGEQQGLLLLPREHREPQGVLRGCARSSR